MKNQYLKKIFRLLNSIAAAILCFFQLCGCTGVLYKQDLDSFNSGKKSMIIMQQYIAAITGDKYTMLKTEWQNEQTGEIFNTWGSRYRVETDPEEQFLVYVINPGSYSLKLLNRGIESSNLSDLVSFSVRAGEIVYIGDLVEVQKPGAIVLASVLNVKDRYEEAKSFFKQHYPNIKQIPIRKLMRLSEKVKKLQARYK